ncbi:Sec-independent protein translocase protein TatB [Pseudoxanthomonas winnipegensis]|jgi:sec-independent protein translocase protein TatB|uniref:Sec-independent protein translocase protein TatB n=1 Tax=Pseudoxanthomonas winnipegensis TaxID=2480810 RepID=A0A4Q8LAH3_9GAMM|nr:Sec-independent protein translocase protein TatB [Pseudoxanthomonas winnipegensis]PZP61418.1 MAG: twin-arginine translocase subunit TatB [Pseudoxanthomonas spadix]TAA25631.1 twin-arginine translocase subunit TatB [Pseudoxanthomonas winnipegensis]
MFEIGFPELIVIAVVALVVLGPERLPKAARFAGLWVRRARNQWDSVKQELERELAAEELKRNLHEAQEALRRTEEQARRGGAQAQQQFDELRTAVKDTGAEQGAAASADTAADVAAASAPQAHVEPAAVEPTVSEPGHERPRA